MKDRISDMTESEQMELLIANLGRIADKLSTIAVYLGDYADAMEAAIEKGAAKIADEPNREQ